MEIELASGAPADLYPCIGATRGLVIVPDMLGRRPLYNEMAESMATTRAWNVIVIEPFRRREFATSGTEERHALMPEMNDDDVVGDMVDAANRLEVEPVGLVGFCMGGMYSFKASASHRFDRIVSFYGMIRLPEHWKGPNQREPLALLKHSDNHQSILAIVGTEDHYTPPNDVDDLEKTGVQVVRYEGADHGFVHDPSRPAYRPGDAADAWSRAYAHLVAR